LRRRIATARRDEWRQQRCCEHLEAAAACHGWWCVHRRFPFIHGNWIASAARPSVFSRRLMNYIGPRGFDPSDEGIDNTFVLVPVYRDERPNTKV
jgi:hypothetical protein